MNRRTSYQTKQKGLVLACMAAHGENYLSVDEVHANLLQDGATVGRTTVYRVLEAAASEGTMAKMVGARGDAARYRSRVGVSQCEGQLLCLRCGKAIVLDCSMWESFASHALRKHGFVIDQGHTILYGLCQECNVQNENPSYQDFRRKKAQA